MLWGRVTLEEFWSAVTGRYAELGTRFTRRAKQTYGKVFIRK